MKKKLLLTQSSPHEQHEQNVGGRNYIKKLTPPLLRDHLANT